MKLRKKITVLGAGLACCISLSAIAIEQGDRSSFSEQSRNSSAWQQVFPHMGDAGDDLTSLFYGADSSTEVSSEEAEYGTGTNYTTIPAAALDPVIKDPSLNFGFYSRLSPSPYPPTTGADPVFDLAPGQLIYCPSPDTLPPLFVAPVNLPSGVRLVGFEVYGLDPDNSGAIGGGLINVCNITPGNTPANFGTLSKLSITPLSGVPEMPGVVRLNGSPVDHTVDNENCAYSVAVGATACGGPLAIFKVRLAWRRQITPAPSTASFNDVQVGAPFFREVEALYASGITGGCGGNNYCPNSPVTRGQMAAYLARGLGL